MSSRPLAMAAAFASVLTLAASPSFATFAQQGAKLVGTGYAGTPDQGYGVALSADGNTAIVGGYGDNTSQGAAWIFTRSGNTWTQQGNKLVGTGNTGGAAQGISVGISADGNTAILGGYLDNGGVGAAWVFTRVNGLWAQQGSKLVGTGATGNAHQGWSVSLSGDGNTAIVGGYSDNGNVGAAWVFTRSAGVWTQQGSKLVGTGAVGSAEQGLSTALSADGSTAIIGGFSDNAFMGAAWVFVRSAGVWSQQGAKLVGTGNIGIAYQGISVSLSSDGNTALVGGPDDNLSVGATWVYTRSAGVWSQQGPKLVGTGTVGTAQQGNSVAISGDGNTAIVGGNSDNSAVGATWFFKRSGGTWNPVGAKLLASGVVGGVARQGQSSAISADGNIALSSGVSDNSNIGATWVFVNASPAIVAVNDVPNDQGGRVNLRWNASFLDNVPANAVDQYWIWRQIPASGAHAIESDGSLAHSGPAVTSDGRKLRATQVGAQVYYWEYVGSQVAHGFPAYSYTAPTTADSVPGSNPQTLFMVEAEQLSSGLYWQSDPDSGYSVDNLPPLPPAPVSAIYVGGSTHIHWNPNGESDFALYRVYRGASAGFVPGPGNLIASQPDTGFADPGAPGSFYKLSAVDIHGNESAYVLVTSGATTAVNGPGALEFALAGARPNPASGAHMNIEFSLASAAPARLELFDMSGRRLAAREVGSLGAGMHTVNLAASRKVAPGIYWVELTQGANQLGSRIVVIE